MRRTIYLVLAFLLLVVCSAKAQNGELSVDTFYLAMGDARATGNDAVMDYGEPARPCALIIVHLPLEGASVEKNRLGIVSIKNMPNNEIWVYAPSGSGGPDRIVVKHPNYQDLKVELGDWLESDGEGYLSPATVYHLRIHVPSALLTLAEQKLSRFDFKGADECYKTIVDDTSLDNHDKNIAQERRKHLHTWDRILSLAQKYEKKYTTDKSRGAQKSQIVNDLDSIIHWYGILYSQSGIYKADERRNSASTLLGKIVGKTTIRASLRLIEKEGTGKYKLLKPQRLNGVEVLIEKSNGLTESISLDSDINGAVEFTIEYSYKNKIKFTYCKSKNKSDGKVYESTKFNVTGDSKLDVKMHSK